MSVSILNQAFGGYVSPELEMTFDRKGTDKIHSKFPETKGMRLLRSRDGETYLVCTGNKIHRALGKEYMKDLDIFIRRGSTIRVERELPIPGKKIKQKRFEFYERELPKMIEMGKDHEQKQRVYFT